MTNNINIQMNNNRIYDGGGNANVSLIGNMKIYGQNPNNPCQVNITNTNNKITYVQGQEGPNLIGNFEGVNAHVNMVNFNNTITSMTENQAKEKADKVYHVKSKQKKEVKLNKIDELSTDNIDLKCIATQYASYTMIETPDGQFIKKANWGSQSSSLPTYNVTEQELKNMKIGVGQYFIQGGSYIGVTTPAIIVNGVRYAIPKQEKPISESEKKCIILDAVDVGTLTVNEPVIAILKNKSKIQNVKGKPELLEKY